ncbi:P27 family phage terminase small subunit [Nonlabens sp. SCSIO 43208]|uniref:P27 family phage terminase small subunit n=1 Tax=Nonlabens sp. SCSIO 43208 TaxID=2793009 RepID=UPI003D6B83A1
MEKIKNTVKPIAKNQQYKKVPAAPVYLSPSAKKHWKQVAKILIDAEVLKPTHLTGLEVLVDAKAQFEYAVRAIQKSNRKKAGSGYIQQFSTGAKNISVEQTLKRDAIKTMMQCLKQFGLDPKSEKELNTEPSNQLNLFDGIMKELKKTS